MEREMVAAEDADDLLDAAVDKGWKRVELRDLRSRSSFMPGQFEPEEGADR
jgi:hypothetical protein